MCIRDRRKTYAFDPALLPGINPAAAENITGIEGPLWTEFIETPAQVDAHVYPRLAALAETAWTSAAQKDYAGFERRLRALEPLTAMLGIQATPLEETNPTGWPARQEVMRHFRKALDWEMFKAALATFRPGQDK
jgi:hexosaminidase